MIGFHREQHLARAAKFLKADEDEPNDLLETLIGIKAKPRFPVPDVAERNRQAQFAAAGLGPGSVQHPGAQNAEFELADAAFHAEEQTITWPTRIIDTLAVDDAGFEKST